MRLVARVLRSEAKAAARAAQARYWRRRALALDETLQHVERLVNFWSPATEEEFDLLDILKNRLAGRSDF